MNVLVFAASNHTQSINLALATYAAKRFKQQVRPDASLEFLDLNDYEMPIYSPEREANGGAHPLAEAFYDKIAAADALIVSYAEYNGNYTSAWKNILDWISIVPRQRNINGQFFQHKPMLALATSPGAAGATSVLNLAKASAPHFDADLRASVSIPSFYDHFDLENGELTDPELAEQLNQAVQALAH